MLEPLADSIARHLEDAAETLKSQKCVRESRQLQIEAKNCSRNLGKPGWNWWRQGYGSIGRPWRHESELGAAQKRLQRSSHIMRLSLELGDWSHEREDHRNLRNLSQLRLEGYRKGQSVRDQVKSLTRLRWCLLNASATLYRLRAQGDGSLAESIVLRLEMLEVLSDMAALEMGAAKARIEQEYVKALRTLAGQLQGSEYEGLAYADVRTWALDHVTTAHDDLSRRATRR